MVSASRARELINQLELEPHPEGGWFREVYRSTEAIDGRALPERFEGSRCFATSIYYLLTSNDFSAFHRIAADELWHFYTGSSITIHTIDAGGNYLPVTLGCNPERNQAFQATVPHGTFFAADVDTADSFALVGCTVAPGFEFGDFELARRGNLLNLFPQHSDLIGRLTRT